MRSLKTVALAIALGMFAQSALAETKIKEFDAYDIVAVLDIEAFIDPDFKPEDRTMIKDADGNGWCLENAYQPNSLYSFASVLEQENAFASMPFSLSADDLKIITETAKTMAAEVITICSGGMPSPNYAEWADRQAKTIAAMRDGNGRTLASFIDAIVKTRVIKEEE